MPVIELRTEIAACREIVFDLSRSIVVHMHSAEDTGEVAVAGVTEGLIGMGGQVTWEARHFGVKQRLAVEITRFQRPEHFQDRMISGAFKSMKHDHWFAESGTHTIMTDRFEFESPLGLLGKMVDRWVLTAYMTRFLEKRNSILKKLAESHDWKNYAGVSDV